MIHPRSTGEFGEFVAVRHLFLLLAKEKLGKRGPLESSSDLPVDSFFKKLTQVMQRIGTSLPIRQEGQHKTNSMQRCMSETNLCSKHSGTCLQTFF